MDFLLAAWVELSRLVIISLTSERVFETALKFIPFVLCFELPYQFLVMLGMGRQFLQRYYSLPKENLYYPRVSCLVTCYGEGTAVRRTIHSLAHQIYPGYIEILMLVDGAAANHETLAAAESMLPAVQGMPRRRLRVIPKWQRGGRVSSLNSGLALSSGEIILALDGDTSFDNDMIYQCVKHFACQEVVGVAGNLRVRNSDDSLCTALQTMEYVLSVSGGRVGLSEWGTLNNISGAFGAFRKSFLQMIGGWRTGSAEDLDMTTRIKNFFGRYPHLRIVFEPRAIGHTDVPASFADLFKQRTRWDGDLSFIYLRRYWRSFSPRIFGWRNFLFYAGFGLLFQLVAPMAIVTYSIYLFATRPPGVVIGVMLYVYLFYLVAITLFYLQYLLMVSERPRRDALLAPLLPIYPLYNFVLRLWCALATLRELTIKSNLDTAMAPWWVLRKMK